MKNTMTEKQKRLFELFRLAIEREQQSQALYADLAETCEDAALRQVIDTLRHSEKMHEELLLERYKHIRTEAGFKD